MCVGGNKDSRPTGLNSGLHALVMDPFAIKDRLRNGPREFRVHTASMFLLPFCEQDHRLPLVGDA